MAMNANTLGDAMMAAEDAVYNTYINENSNPANHAAYRQARYRAMAAVIIAHIQQYAEIEPLSVNNTTYSDSNTGPHDHEPAVTVQAAGKIS
ncbi:MAG: hypothetical protein WBP42_11535 [Candidatus Zixiibacteriota bacterium]